MLLCCACGLSAPGATAAGPTGRSDAQGTLQGQPFTASDSLSYVGLDIASNSSFLTVWVSSFPSACGLAAQNAGVRNASVLVFNLQGQRSAATQPGVYTFGASPEGKTAQAAALRTDETCPAAPLSARAPATSCR